MVASFAFNVAFSTAFVFLMAVPRPLAAQDMQAPQRLEDLIPDAAVEDPEAWAGNGISKEIDQEDDGYADLDPDSPLAEMAGLDEPLPDEAEELPQLAPLEPDEDIRFAEVEGVEDQVGPVLADARIEAVGAELSLAFPDETAAFPMREEFVDRFKSLSKIEELSSDEASIAQVAARARQDQELLRQLLDVYGYYDAQVLRTLDGVQPAVENGEGQTARREPTVRFDIIPGARFRFGTVNLGQLETAPDHESLRATFGIYPGDPMSSDAIIREQFALDTALGETGYPFAEINAPSLLVDHARSQGDLTMIVLPGGKYVFGDVNSDLPDFLSGRHLQNIARFDAGDTFKRSLMLDLRRAIVATGLVSSVTLTPREVTAPTAGQPGVVALDVGLTKAPLRTIAGAIGYGTEEGFRVQASWEHRNLFPPEGSLRVRGVMGTQEQLFGVTLRKNNFGGRDRIATADAYISSLDTAAYAADTVALRGTFETVSTLLFQKPLSWAVGAEILATDERNRIISGVPRPRQTYFIASAFGEATIDTSDSLLNPAQGFRLRGFVAPEISRTANQDYFYVRAQVDASKYQQVTDNVVLAGRVRGATIKGAPLFAIAPSRRLYSGGGGSLRGYGYQAVGPKNDFLEPVGGRSLVEISAEARVKTGWFGGALSVVPFLDAGSVSISSTPDFRFIKYGAGIGVRYESGFGPLRVDVGVPLNPDENDSPLAVYVSLGQAF